jgi:hypothetical protein
LRKHPVGRIVAEVINPEVSYNLSYAPARAHV